MEPLVETTVGAVAYTDNHRMIIIHITLLLALASILCETVAINNSNDTQILTLFWHVRNADTVISDQLARNTHELVGL